MGGPRLTPEQIEKASAVYAKTGNVSEAARAIGCPIQTLSDAFKRIRIVRNRKLHAEACERAMRRGRQRIEHFASVIEGSLGNAGELEPKDAAALINAHSKAMDTILAIADAERVRKQSKLSRDKTRAEIDMLRARIAGTLPAEKHDVTLDARDALAERLARLARPEQPDGAREGDPPADPSRG